MILFWLLIPTWTEGAVPKSRFYGNLQSRIVGGHAIDIKDAPYQVSIEHRTHFQCGGSILNSNSILTAQHCIQGNGKIYQRLLIRAGSSFRQREGSTHDVSLIQCHPLFDYLRSTAYDLAIVHIDPPLQFDETRQPINITTSEPITGDDVTITGWGRDGDNGIYPQQLHSATVPVTDREVCRHAYANESLPVTDAMFCSGTGAAGLCYGDSGGPVVKEGQQVGITGWGLSCASNLYRGVSTNLAHKDIQRWIQNSLSNN